MPDFPSSSSASGIWQMRQVKRAVQGGNWPFVVISDPYFDYVSLLLPGNGTNGAQNNTFLDSSTNAFSITRNGNTTQGTFTPYGPNWSNFFDGSGDYLSVPGSSAFAYGTGSFTIEFWIFGLIANDRMIYDARNGGGTGPQHFTTGGYGGSLIGALRYVGSSEIISTAIISDNTWHHCAIVRNGSSAVTLYVDGVASGSGTDTTNYTATSGNNLICRNSYGAGGEFNGYLSNFRIVKGVALYTSNFTPSTTPLTAVANTSLLTCQSNRFIDNSSNNFTITRFGETSVQRFSPFNPTASYAADTVGGSGVFDAVNDTLTTPVNAAFNLGTGAFQIDFWMYPTGSPGQFMGPFGTNNNGGTGGIFFANRSGNLDFVSNNDNITLIRATYPSLNNWHHVVLVRNSSGLRAFFLDGVRVGTASDAADFNQTQFTLGAYNASFGGWPGYLSNFRIIKGSNIADPNSATVAVPTAPTTAVAGTQFLCNFTNAGIIDNAMMNNLETVGNAQISTAQSKFGGGSMAFDGSGDYLKLSNNTAAQALGFGTGDFTIECWVYPTTSAAANNGIYDCRYSASATGPLLYNIPASGLYMFYNGSNVITGSNPTINTWSHIALVRSSGVTKLYLNGVQTGSNYTDTNNYTSGSNSGAVGAFYDGSASFNGYIDDLRITRGFARYTSNFSVPTAPFPTQ